MTSKRKDSSRVQRRAPKRRASGPSSEVQAHKERLQKTLAAAGVASRRACEELIVEGVVRVNGKVVDTLPAFVNPDKDVITVNKRRIRAEQKVYFLLNKPKGVICTSSDPHGRAKAVDLIDCKERVFCVGRLDADTTGGIILTNDSELANRLTHPRSELPKTYEVRVRGRIEGDAIEKVKRGTWLAEGKTGRAAVKVIKRSRDESLLEVTIRQGLNRQVRRIMARVGFKVRGLKRTKIGNIGIKGLAMGGSRKLTKSQISYLRKVTGL
ncbi:MAG: rRNA pseudouridine synthase [Planctomycetes bacterium]|nr:rRNA pseudouridine synthase [Planctomycetota bacterium]